MVNADWQNQITQHGESHAEGSQWLEAKTWFILSMSASEYKIMIVTLTFNLFGYKIALMFLTHNS